MDFSPQPDPEPSSSDVAELEGAEIPAATAGPTAVPTDDHELKLAPEFPRYAAQRALAAMRAQSLSERLLVTRGRSEGQAARRHKG